MKAELLFLLLHYLLLFNHKLGEYKRAYKDNRRYKPQNLRSIDRDAEKTVSVALNVLYKETRNNRGKKTANTANTVFESRCLNEILLVNVAVSNVQEVSRCSRRRDV